MSLSLRIALGSLIFATLAIIDLRRNGRAARRWREYLFLIAATLLAMVYGIVNDQITSSISWEYFYYGKELYTVLGPQTPPDAFRLHLQAARIGAEATWTVGLLLGAALLIANNPRARRPPLSFRKLLHYLLIVLLMTIPFAVAGGTLGALGLLDNCSDDFRTLATMNPWRPRHFMACWGIHLGDYAGGLIGGTCVVIAVARRRTSPSIAAGKLPAEHAQPTYTNT